MSKLRPNQASKNRKIAIVGTDGTYLYIPGHASTGLNARVVKFAKGALAYSATQALTLPGAPGGEAAVGSG